MGEFKPLLPLRGATLIENSVGSALAGGAETATVVTGFRAGDVERVLSRAFGERVRFVRNGDYARTDMMRSIQLGAAALPDCGAFFLLPGDMPAVSPETFARLLAARRKSPSGVVFPTLDGSRKHPPLIDSRLIPAILAFDGEGGLRELWSRLGGEIQTVPVEDAGVWVDVDTPDDYRQCRQNYETGIK
ncbi:MAG: nucleotidyltransferase family protein [Oscillospiraceae bacterium]|nr:nucleotidyltransferase family protein [Oscillospiraceae bacterium]